MFSKCFARNSALAVLLTATWSQAVLAMEDTKVLPKGVRNVILRSVQTRIDATTDAQGNKRELGAPLERGVTFEQLTSSRSGLERSQAEAVLLLNGIGKDEEIGQFTADMRGQVQVVAPAFSYGWSERLTLAVAVPIYSASTSVEMGFRTSERGQEFLNILASPQYNNTAKAREAGAQMNAALARLNAKLAASDYQPLADWSATAPGDVLLLTKYRAFSTPYGSGALTNGVSLPTGRVDDPDILNDISFGSGTYGIIAGASFDQPLIGPLFVNEYASYTAYLPTDRAMRMKTATETLDVETRTVRIDPGDKLDVGASLQIDAENGAQGGIGYILSRKFDDKIRAGESRAVLEANTLQTAQTAEAALGYSTIPAFKRGSFAVPMTTLGTYRKQVKSTNQAVADQFQLDLKVYF